MREHRYKFYLSSDLEVEKSAWTYIEKQEQINPFRSSELVRRLISQGFSFWSMLNKVDIEINEIENALRHKVVEKKSELLLRLNPGDMNSTEGVWKAILDDPLLKSRRQMLRKLFLYGYWLESTPETAPTVISNVIMPTTSTNVAATMNAVSTVKPKAKQSLGNLMP